MAHLTKIRTHIRSSQKVVAIATTLALIAAGSRSVGAAPSLITAAPDTPSPAAPTAGRSGLSKQPAPPGRPAPPGFAATLERIYAEASSYAGLPGKMPAGHAAATTAPMSAAAFHTLVASLTPEELNQTYDYNAAGWGRVDATLSAYSRRTPPSALASQIAQAYSALAARSAGTGASVPATPAAGAIAPAAEATSPEPEIFNPPPCPAPDLGGDDGYDLLFGFQTAADIADIPAQPFLASLTVFLEPVVIALLVVALALEIPALTTELLIDLGARCTTSSLGEEAVVINKNIVNADKTAIAILGLEQQMQQFLAGTTQLLDGRSQTIISKLNAGQASLDAAQQQAIESALAGGPTTAIASYELPVTLGGYLNSTPIGVQAIVTNAVARLQQAHQPVSPTASRQLATANSALAAGQFKTAFFAYQATYQALNH